MMLEFVLHDIRLLVTYI